MRSRGRHLVGMAACVALLSGCYADRSDGAAEAGAVCGAGAELVDALAASRRDGAETDGLVARLEALDGALVRRDNATRERESVRGLLAVARDGAIPGTDGDAWYQPLAALDEALAARCGFSLEVLVNSRAEPTPLRVALDVPAEDVSDTGLLTWAAIRPRLRATTWIDRGYEVVVGTGPGVYVTVFRVESRAQATAVCRDIRRALEPEARTQRVQVVVHGLGRAVLARSADGDCADSG